MFNSPAVNWEDARRRVINSYRTWLRAAPEIRSLYTINMPVARIRNQIRHEFETKRHVTQLATVDVLIMHSDQEYQVRSRSIDVDSITPSWSFFRRGATVQLTRPPVYPLPQEMMNFWKQVPHVLKYFEGEENVKGKTPASFIDAFLKVSTVPFCYLSLPACWFIIVDIQTPSSSRPATRRRLFFLDFFPHLSLVHPVPSSHILPSPCSLNISHLTKKSRSACSHSSKSYSFDHPLNITVLSTHR